MKSQSRERLSNVGESLLRLAFEHASPIPSVRCSSTESRFRRDERADESLIALEMRHHGIVAADGQEASKRNVEWRCLCALTVSLERLNSESPRDPLCGQQLHRRAGRRQPNGIHFDEPERASVRFGHQDREKPDASAFRLIIEPIKVSAIGRQPRLRDERTGGLTPPRSPEGFTDRRAGISSRWPVSTEAGHLF